MESVKMIDTSKVYVISTDTIKNAHNGYFFSPNNMRFFRSRVSQIGYISNDRKIATFVTSECDNDKSPRYYSVRIYNFLDDNITNLGKFQEYSSSGAAHKAAKIAIAKYNLNSEVKG